MSIDSLRVTRQYAPAIRVSGTYQDRRATLEAHAIQNAREVLTVNATVPIDLRLRSVAERLPADSLTLQIHADSAELAGLEGVAPQIHGLAGQFGADVTVRGTYKQIRGAGQASIHNGSFESQKLGTVGRGVLAHLTFAGDTVRVDTLRMADGDSPRDTISFRGVLFRNADAWQADLTSVSKNFRIIDDPKFASIDATWNVHASGPLKHPQLEGQIALPEATFIVGQQRRIRDVDRFLPGADENTVVGMPVISRLHVQLGSDVRLKSSDANVQLTGNLELSGPLNDPVMQGEVNASHGTYRVNVGVLKRTFRVDSGTVRLDGALVDPRTPTLNVWASYAVRRADFNDQITINAHVTGNLAAPRLQLISTDIGTAVATSEIISYLLFGAPTVGLSGQASSTVQTATAALVPSLGGVLEGALGSFVPFFSSLQVTTAPGNGPQSVTTSPLDGLLNSFALSAGRQVGSDSFINLSGGVCRGNRLSSAQSSPGWFGASIEYEPKYRLSAVLSMDPGVTPCTSVGKFQRRLSVRTRSVQGLAVQVAAAFDDSPRFSNDTASHGPTRERAGFSARSSSELLISIARRRYGRAAVIRAFPRNPRQVLFSRI